MKLTRILLCAVLVAVVSSCSKPQWHTLRDGNLYYGKLDKPENCYWEGSTVGRLPIDKGILVMVKDNNKISKEKRIDMTFGTDIDKYPYPSIRDGRYLGETKKMKGSIVPHGFGVLIGDEYMYYGTFKSGLLDGKDCTICKSYGAWEVIYVGGCLKGVREGEGEEYIDGQLVYSGSWKNDKRDGKGIEYKDGRIFYEGTWKQGVAISGEIDKDKGWTKIK